MCKTVFQGKASPQNLRYTYESVSGVLLGFCRKTPINQPFTPNSGCAGSGTSFALSTNAWLGSGSVEQRTNHR